MIFGTFDGLHPGHHFVLAEALGRGEVTVIVARDGNVEKMKGRRPKQSEGERLRAMQSAFPSADVRLGDPEDFLTPVRKVQPDLIVLGYDQRLPPGVSESDLKARIERLPPFEPEKYKSSLL